MANPPRRLVFPFEPDYTNIINQVETDVSGVISAVDSVIPGVIPPIPTPSPASVPPVTSVDPLPSQPVIPQQGNVTNPPISVPVINVAEAFEDAIGKAAKDAWPIIQPQLQQDAISYLHSYVEQMLKGNSTPQIPNVTIDGQSLTQMAARGHAWRTFLVGMGATALTAVVSAVGNQAHLDLFTRDGWVATGSIAVGTLVQTLLSYFGRLQIAPEYERQLAAAPPSLALLRTQKK